MMATDGTTLLVLAELAARATLVLALAWLGARVALRRSASTRYAVWAAGFIAAFALPIAAGVLPAWRLAVLPAAAPVTPTDVGRQVENIRHTPLQSAPTPKRTDGGLPASPSVERSSRLSQLADAVTPMTWGLLAWAAIATGLVLRYLISLFAVRWMTRRADQLDDARWRDALDVATATLGLTRTPQLVVSARVSVPFTCGLFRPVLVVPIAALAWTDERIHVVLLHELAHVVRRDCLLQAVSHVVCAIYWFNPLAWLGARRLRAERERACDDLVLACGTPGADYAQHLLDIARAATLDTRPALASAALAMARPSELEGRLLAILDPRRSRARAAHHLLWKVAVLATVIALPVATVRLVARPAVVPEITVADRGTATTPSHGDGVEAAAPHRPTSIVPAVKAKPLGDIGAARAAGDSGHDGSQTVSPVLSAAKTAESKSTKGNSNDNNDDEEEPRAVSPAVLQALMDALKDSDAEVRKSAMHALSRFRSPAAFDAFVVGLKDQDPEVRQQAASALSQLRDGRATDALIAALKDENAEVRQQAAFALSQLRVARAVPALVVALKDVDDDVREQALFALSQIRDASAVPALIGALSDAKPNVREQAAFALSQIGDRAAVPGLIAALKDKEPSVREQAAFALSQIGDESAIEALTAAIKDPVADVRQQAIFALSQLADGGHRGRNDNPEPVVAPTPPTPAPTPK
jgi:HEAT repeat protein/beta-lactamase regulating signal transducer with metallopeptidase domain